SLGADGWAATGTGTTGGDGAVAAKTYTVTNRNELIQALYGNTATIAADGSYTGTLDPAKKLIYVKGRISLNVNQALTEQTADDYIKG
ncbi:pectate lyase, partial [Pseudomonas sp. GW456-12-1-14-LB2]